jgi:dipicolinate synthase subunit A
MKIIFLGGDMRQKYASDYINKHGHISKAYLNFSVSEIEEDILNSDVIAFPLPATNDGIHINMPTRKENEIAINDIIDIISINALIIGGKFSQESKEIAVQNGRKIIDYMDIEPFQIKNALLSAEGAIYYAKQRFDKSIHGAKIAVLGSGRIGKILAYLLRGQGALVTVIARKDADLTWSEIIGYNTKRFSHRNTGVNNKFDIIFNTIPYHILDDNFAKMVDKNVLIIDLASSPYGIDDKLVKENNLNYYRELGIPGRYAPKSAGEIIGHTIINNILIKEDFS